MMLLKNLHQPSEEINRRIRVVPVLPSQIKRKSQSAPIVVEGTTSKKIASSSRGKSNSTQIKNKMPPSTVAAVSKPPENSKDTIAFVDTDNFKKIVTNNTI